MKNKVLKFISDPGHGWLSVSLKDIRSLDLKDKISPYSYMSLTRAYLEEDSDMGLFLNAAKEKGLVFSIKDSHVENTPIRSMAGFNAEMVDFCESFKIGSNVLLYNETDKVWNIRAKIIDEHNNKYIMQTMSNYKCQVSKHKLLSHIKPMPDSLINTIEINGPNDCSFLVRLVKKGDSYGLNKCLTHEEDMPLVEFYDKRYKHTEYGQFVSRYCADTLLESKNDGLLLDTGSPEWTVDGRGMNSVRFWLGEDEYVMTAMLAKEKTESMSKDKLKVKF